MHEKRMAPYLAQLSYTLLWPWSALQGVSLFYDRD